MQERPLVTPLVLLCAALQSCSVFESAPAGPASVEDLVDRIHKVRAAAELVQNEVKAALERARFVAAAGSGDGVERAVSAFRTAAAESRNQVTALQGTIEPMEQAAAPVFSQWEADIGEIHSPAMRRRSRERMDEAQGRYRTARAAARSAHTACEEFNQILQGHEGALASGASEQAIAALRDDLQHLTSLEAEIQRRLGMCRESARAYVATSAVPGARDGAEPAAPVGPTPANPGR